MKNDPIASNKSDSVFETITDAFISLDKEWCFTYVNQQAELLLGKGREELLGRNVFDLFPESLGSHGHQETKRAIENNMPVQYEEYAEPLDRWYLTNIYPVPEGVVVYFKDITEHKRAEERDHYMAMLLESMTDAVLSTDNDGIILSWNKGAEKMYGFAAEEVLGKDVVDILHTEYINATRKEVIEYVVRRGRWRGEIIQTRKDGTKIRVLSSAAAVKDSTGKVIGRVGVNRDITRRKQVEEALARLAAIVESSSDVIIGVHLDGTVTSWNKGAERLYGWKESEMVGQSIERIIPDELQSEMHAFLDAAGRGQRVQDHETFRINKSGEMRSVTLSVSPITDNSGTVMGASVIAHDISERKRAEELLRHANEQLAFILRGVTDGIIARDRQYNIVYANDVAAHVFGYASAEELMKSTPEELARNVTVLDENGELLINRPSRRALKGESVPETLVRYLLRDGTERWTMVKATPVIDEKGKVIIGVSILRDITDRREEERRKEKRSERQRTLTEISMAALSSENVQDLFNKVARMLVSTLDAEYTKVLELLPETNELVLRAGVGWDEKSYGKMSASVDSLAEYAFKTGLPVIMKDMEKETRFPTPLLLKQHNIVSGMSAVISLRGEKYGVLGVHTTQRRDFTDEELQFLQIVANTLGIALERHYSEELMRENEAKLQTITNAVPALIAYVDKDLRYVTVNRAYNDWYMQKANDFIGRHVSDMVSEKLYSEVVPYMKRALAGETVSYEKWLEYVSGPRYVHVTYIPDVGEDGVRGFTLLAEDLTKRKLAEEQIHSLSRVLLEHMENTPLAVVEYNPDFTIRRWSSEAEHMFGFTAEEMLGNDLSQIRWVHEDDAERVGKVVDDLKSGTKTRMVNSNRNYHKDGHIIDCEWYISALRDKEGSLESVLCFGLDVTDRNKAEERLRATFEQAAVGMAHVSLDGRWLRVNRKLCSITGYGEDELLGNRFEDITYIDDRGISDEFVQELIDGKRDNFSIEKRYVRKDREIVWVRITASLVRSPHGRPKYFITVVEDITEHRHNVETIRHQALHDPLTTLPNRKALEDRLTRALQDAQAQEQMIAVMFLDIDNFKQINDTHGHTAGDLALKEIGARFRSCVRDDDTVARLGGDEFIIMLSHIFSIDDVMRVAERIFKALQAPVIVGQNSLELATSIGITIYPTDGTDIHTLLKNADRALYRAKEAGKNRYHIYNRAADKQIAERFTLENELRDAIRRNELVLHYQPIIHTKNKKIVSMEALVRWNHPRLGLIYPNEFIPVAETMGLIVPLGEWVLREACRQNKEWQDKGLPSFAVAVNLSAHQFAEPGLVGMIKDILAETGLQADCLELEITESVAMGNLEHTINTLNELDEMGVHITLDDFGTGYSSLSYLKRFPVHNIKIDQSFIRNCLEDEQDAAIIKTIITMAYSLGLKVVAEGVEKEEQAAFLHSLSCHRLQGYLIKRPAPGDDIEQWVRSEMEKWQESR